MELSEQKTIIIGFSRPQKWKIFAELIMWWDKNYEGATVRMSHAYTRFLSRAWERDFIYQAAGTKTHFTGSCWFEKENVVVEEYLIPVSVDAEATFGKTCVDREGRPYGMKQIFGNILINVVRIATLNQVRMSNPLADKEESVTCLEEMGWLLAEHFQIEPPKNLESISIWEFRNFVAGLPGVQIRRNDGL